MPRPRKTRSGQPKSRKGQTIWKDYLIKTNTLTRQEIVSGNNRLESDPKYYLFPLADGMLRAARHALTETGKAAQATIMARRQPRKWRIPPGASTSQKLWLDSGYFRKTLHLQWMGTDEAGSYRIMPDPERCQTAELRANLKTSVPIFGNAQLMARDPEVMQGARESLELLMTEDKGAKRK